MTHLPLCMLIALFACASVKAAESNLDWVTPVVASKASCIAVSDVGKLLMVGGQDETGGYLLLHSLDAKGLPAGEGIRFTEPFMDNALRPVDLRAHPTQPLLYLWRDAIPTEKVEAPGNDFAHLLIYRIKDGTLQPAGQFAAGSAFAAGKQVGMMSLDTEYQRLFLPNGLTPGKDGEMVPVIACIDLDQAGMPLTDANGNLTMRSSPLGRLASNTGGPCGVVSGSRDVVVFGANRGFGVWEQTKTESRLSHVPLHWSRQDCFLAGHPDKSTVYLAPSGWRYLYVMQHVEGYITMMPQIYELSEAGASSQPVIMPSRNMLAVGAFASIYLISLDADGRLTDGAQRLRYVTHRVESVAYSTKHDRLYVPVETLP